MPQARARAKLPPFLKRRLFVMIVSSVGVGLLAPLVSVLAEGRVPLWAYIIGVSVPGIASGVIGSTWGIAAERTQKRAKAIGGRVCWECGYSLEGLGAAGTCPECGHDYDVADLRRRWWAPEEPPGVTAAFTRSLPPQGPSAAAT